MGWARVGSGALFGPDALRVNEKKWQRNILARAFGCIDGDGAVCYTLDQRSFMNYDQGERP